MKKLLMPFLLSMCFQNLSLAEEIEKLKVSAHASSPDDYKTRPEKWRFGVDISATGNWTVDRKFVGVTDGHYLSLGGKIVGTVGYVIGPHEWITTLGLLETFSQTPLIDALIKSADQLNFESDYYYYLANWYGLFGQLKLDTSIFASSDQRAAPVTYQVSDASGAALAPVTASSFGLTTPFMPLYLQENLGVFFKPFRETAYTWELYVAASFRETFANGQKVVTGNSNNVVSIKTLYNFEEIGPMVGTVLSGEIYDKRVSYKAGIDTMYVLFRFAPYPSSSSFVDHLNTEAFANLSFKLFKWMSLTWDFKAIRTPEIISDFQIQSNLLLTFNYVL